MNAEYNLFEPDERETSSVFSADGDLLRQTVFQFKENEWNSEVSGDYELDFGPGRLKFIGLQRNEHSPTRARSFGANLDGSDLVNRIFDRTVDESESILRTEYNLSGANNSDWQFSIEGALNTLDSEALQYRGDTFDSVSVVDMSNDAVRVEEKRAEAFITHGRQLNKDLRLQVSLGAEQSEIMSDGANGQTRNFTRPKGSASLAWTVDESTTINASVERIVGQLNFFDFVNNVDLNVGDDSVGNAQIVPDQRWRLAVEVEKDFGTWGAVTAEIFGDEIEDLNSLVPIGEGEGPGNIDSASRIAIEIEGTLKFDNLGWQGAQLEFETFAQDTFVDDPFSNVTRDFNGSTIYYYELQFRHDIPNTDWAWGINYERFENAPNFRSNVRRLFTQPQGFSWGFIEHKDIYGMTGSVFLGNLLDSDDNFQRIVYAPGGIERIEDRSRNFGNILTLRLKGTF